MGRIHLFYVVAVALLSPHYAWSPTTAALLCPSQAWKAKNRLRFPDSGFSRWILQAARCSSRIASPDDQQHTSAGSARRCAADILALMGGAEQKSKVDAYRARELMSCIRFLVPVSEQKRQSSKAAVASSERILKLIREPPAAVADLAWKAVEWGGEPEAVLAELDPTLHKVPHVEGPNADKCVLTKYDFAKRFAQQEINLYLDFLFEAIVALAPSSGFNVSLNRYDLFHGHMFTAHDSGRLGILFHAREYPEFDKNGFPMNLGYCQTGSCVPYDRSMNLRNIVWLAPMPSFSASDHTKAWLAPGALFILDARPDGIVFKELVSEWVDVVRTIYESDFGTTVIDVNYFNTDDNSHIFLT